MTLNNPHQNSDGPQNTYRDIINLKRPVIKNHPPMSRGLRAAQFAPYAALVGHKDLIRHIEAEDTYIDAEIIPDYQDGFPDENYENSSNEIFTKLS